MGTRAVGEGRRRWIALNLLDLVSESRRLERQRKRVPVDSRCARRVRSGVGEC
jgi:hypothetical protein